MLQVALAARIIIVPVLKNGMIKSLDGRYLRARRLMLGDSFEQVRESLELSFVTGPGRKLLQLFKQRLFALGVEISSLRSRYR